MVPGSEHKRTTKTHLELLSQKSKIKQAQTMYMAMSTGSTHSDIQHSSQILLNTFIDTAQPLNQYLIDQPMY